MRCATPSPTSGSNTSRCRSPPSVSGARSKTEGARHAGAEPRGGYHVLRPRADLRAVGPAVAVSVTSKPAAAAGTIKLGDLTVNRLGFGAMRVAGAYAWGR